jgi:homoserine dehydrogenase
MTRTIAATVVRETLGLASSGTSPGVRTRLFLVGLGAVGRSFLRRWDAASLQLVAASDSSGTLVEREGLDAHALEQLKAERRALAATGLAEDLPLELLVELVRADVLVDASASVFGDGSAAVERTERALRAGSRVVFASKDALAARAHEWRAEIASGRVGWNAALGGTGLRLAAELGELAPGVQEIELVANATTSCVLDGLERGADWEGALCHARERGLCEGSAEADLDGRDAAAKLAIVAGALFGRRIEADAIERSDLRTLDLDLVRARAARGRTTRLVARATRDGRLCVRPEELPRGSIFAAPCDRVVYSYRARDGRRRVHIGAGLGPERTALALLADVGAAGGAA